eukprot:384740-Hanusia_phi.AAC.3
MPPTYRRREPESPNPAVTVPSPRRVSMRQSGPPAARRPARAGSRGSASARLRLWRPPGLSLRGRTPRARRTSAWCGSDQ